MNRRKFLLNATSIILLPSIFLSITGCEKKKKEKNAVKPTNPKIQKLNLAIEHEYGAIIQYCNHAGIVSHNDFEKAIVPIICQEVEHAIIISKFIKSLGYSPTISSWPPQTANSFKDILKLEISTEEGAISLYEEILKLKLPESFKKKINKILKIEENHLKIFKNFFNEKF